MTHRKGYGQFCPIARASEVIGERWTPLVLRELLCGSVHFNELQRGVPRMSPALLSRRLKELQQAGIIERTSSAERGVEYHLTRSGRELLPVLKGMGDWAQRWLRPDLTASPNLDPDLLMWDVRRRVRPPRARGNQRYVVRFHYEGVPATHRRYWLVFENDFADLCIKDPGFEIDLYVSSHLRVMTQIWLGHLPIKEALRRDLLQLDGKPRDIAGFPAWFSLSLHAESGRRPAGAASGDAMTIPGPPAGQMQSRAPRAG